MQVKLLRALQEKEIEYVGGSSPVKINVRIVAATSRNLEKEVSTGNFRLDLYYRLNVFPITLPPLRERRTDIEALVLFFSRKFCEAFRKPFNGIEGSMLEKMYSYDWPGNIRELENVVEQSVVLNDGRTPLQLKRSLTPADLNLQGGNNVNTMAGVKLMQQETEREYIRSVLKKTKGRVRGANGAAELLSIKPTTLEARMAKLKISRQISAIHPTIYSIDCVGSPFSSTPTLLEFFMYLQFIWTYTPFHFFVYVSSYKDE